MSARGRLALQRELDAARSRGTADSVDRVILAKLAKGPASPGALMSAVCSALPHLRVAGTVAVERIEALRAQGVIVSAPLGFCALAGGEA